MADLNQSPALWAVYHATQAVESLGTGEAYTRAVVMCSDAMQAVEREVQQRIAAQAEAGRLREALETLRESVTTHIAFRGGCEADLTLALDAADQALGSAGEGGSDGD